MGFSLQRAIVQSFKFFPGGLRQRMAGEPVSIGGRTLDPTFQIFWNQGKAAGDADLTVESMRAAIRMGAVLLDAKPEPMASIEDRVLSQDNCSVPVRIFRPHGASEKAPALLWFHQGGFVIGGVENTETVATRFARTMGCVVISAGYRLAPEHRFPAALDDGLAAFRWLVANGESIGIDPKRIMVGGESAGGFLAAHVTTTTKRAGETKPLAQILVYPWLVADEQSPSYETYAEAYPLGQAMMDWFSGHVFESEEQRRSELANPGKAADLSEMPASFIYPAGFDPLTDEAETYADRLKAAGNRVTFHRFDNLAHAFLGMEGAIPAARQAVDRIAADVGSFLNEPAS